MRDAGLAFPRKPTRHGTTYGYAEGCRCDACREAKNASTRKYRKEQRRMTDPIFQHEPDESVGDPSPEGLARFAAAQEKAARAEHIATMAWLSRLLVDVDTNPHWDHAPSEAVA